jgi:hypothetical protein
MSWKNILKDIKKQEMEVWQNITHKDRNFSVEILDSNKKRLEVSSYSFKIYTTTENQGGVYLEQIDRVEGEVSFYSRIPPNDEDYEDKDFITKKVFEFEASNSEFDVEYVVNLNQKSQLVLEVDLKGGDLMMKYENGNLTLEQLAITYEASK